MSPCVGCVKPESRGVARDRNCAVRTGRETNGDGAGLSRPTHERDGRWRLSTQERLVACESWRRSACRRLMRRAARVESTVREKVLMWRQDCRQRLLDPQLGAPLRRHRRGRRRRHAAFATRRACLRDRSSIAGIGGSRRFADWGEHGLGAATSVSVFTLGRIAPATRLTTRPNSTMATRERKPGGREKPQEQSAEKEFSRAAHGCWYVSDGDHRWKIGAFNEPRHSFTAGK